jgi:hypothetical protein
MTKSQFPNYKQFQTPNQQILNLLNNDRNYRAVDKTTAILSAAGGQPLGHPSNPDKVGIMTNYQFLPFCGIPEH